MQQSSTAVLGSSWVFAQYLSLDRNHQKHVSAEKPGLLLLFTHVKVVWFCQKHCWLRDLIVPPLFAMVWWLHHLTHWLFILGVEYLIRILFPGEQSKRLRNRLCSVLLLCPSDSYPVSATSNVGSRNNFLPLHWKSFQPLLCGTFLEGGNSE